MALGDGAHDGQAQARARLAGIAGAKEALAGALTLCAPGCPGPLSTTTKRASPGSAATRTVTWPPRRRVAHGVVQQVRQGLLQQARLGLHPDRLAGHVQPEVDVPARASVHHARARSSARAARSIGSETSSAVSVRASASIWLVWRTVSSSWTLMRQQGVAQPARVGLAQRESHLRGQRGQRRAQLVRGVVDEAPPRLAEPAVRSTWWLIASTSGCTSAGMPPVAIGRQVLRRTRCALRCAGAPADAGPSRSPAPAGHQRPAPATRSRASACSTSVRVNCSRDFSVSATWMTTRCGAALTGQRTRQQPGITADAHRFAEVGGVAELRLAGHQRACRWRQVGVADLDESVLGGHAVVHRPAGGELEELEHAVGQLNTQAATVGGDVGVDRLDGAEQRAVVSGIGGIHGRAPGQPQFDADHQQHARQQHHQQGSAQAEPVPGVESHPLLSST